MERDFGPVRHDEPSGETTPASNPEKNQPQKNGFTRDDPSNGPPVSGPRAGAGAREAAPRRTEDERMLDRQLPAEPVARAAELGAFTHTEAWRVLRIQGEFVAGIDALAEIGAAVSVFGSAVRRVAPNVRHVAPAGTTPG